MEDTEPVKEWFVTHEGKQFGPVSMDDLKFEAERGELNPRLDMVWKSGMEDWIPAGEVEGLFKRNEEAKAAEEAKRTSFTQFKPDISEEEKKLIKGEWTGAGRGTYLFVCYILPFLWMAGVGYAMKFLEGKVDSGMLTIGGLVLCLVPFILLIVATLQRFQNLGMSRAWFFGLFAPFLNLWVWYRLFACPPGYAYHKKLDPLGWVLAVIHWGSLLLVVAAFGFAVFTLTQAGEDDPTRVAIEKFIEDAQKAQEQEKR
jgi:hypothetical protein